MLDEWLANDVLMIAVAGVFGLLLLSIGVFLGRQLAKRSMATHIHELELHTQGLEKQLTQMTTQYTDLKQEHAGVKYELGSLQRDKAYLEAKLKG